VSAARIAAIALALVASVAHADGDPAVEFKGIALGIGESRLRDAFPFFQCRNANPALADRTCVADPATRAPAFAEIGGAPLREIIATFLDDRLAQLAITYDPDDYPRVEDALAAKLGPPSIKDVNVINRRGATIHNAVARWSLPSGIVENRRYGVTLDKASLTLSSPSFTIESQRRQLEAYKAKARPSQD
jgi:hypothetical protein